MQRTTNAERQRGRRRLIGLGTGLVALGASLTIAAPASAAPLPTPTRVAVSGVTYQSFAISAGGSATKFYSVYLDGRLLLGLAESNATTPIVIRGLTQQTRYTVQVQQVNPPRFLNSSALSAPIVVTTLAYVPPVLPTSPANVRAAEVTDTAATLTWDAVSGATSYRVYRNGVLFGATAATSLRVEPTLGLNGDIPGTGLMPGRANRVSVSAVGPSGPASIVSEIVVTTPGIAPAAPSAPPGLTVSRVTNNAIVLAWSPSIDGTTAVTEFAYEIFVNGIRQGPSCVQYCFGATGGSAINLAPGTTYRIGVRASSGATLQVSDLSELTATTAAP